MKRLMTYTAVILATLLVLQILWEFRLVVLLFTLSLFVAAAIRPFVNLLTDWGLPRVGAQVLLYGVGIGSLLLLLVLLGDTLFMELNILANRAVIEYESVYRAWQEGSGWQQTAASWLDSSVPFLRVEEADLEEMLPAVVLLTQNVLTAVGGLLLLLVLSVYWSADQYRFERLWLSLLPPRRRATSRDGWRDIEHAVGSYLRSQGVQSILAVTFLGIGAALANLDFPLLLALSGGLLAFVPLFGGLLISVVALVLGSLQSVPLGIGAALYSFVLFLVLEFFVEPRLWPQARGRRSFLLTILLVIPLLEAVGFWGLLVAPPLAAALEVIIGQVYQSYVQKAGTAVHLHDLEERYQSMLTRVNAADQEDLTPELKNLSQRLAGLLANSRELRLP
ncbi:MAG: AI-2E family transporter [Anaerolineaceae bacterium]|nr:AI-2E family transporter [Anaerolineaceae bacterium]